MLQMNLENNVASVPSSDASIAEKVAPEPLEPPEAELPNEASTSGVEEGIFEVTFHNGSGRTEVTIVGVDQEMLLFDITLAFNETGVRYEPFFATDKCVAIGQAILRQNILLLHTLWELRKSIGNNGDLSLPCMTKVALIL